VIEGALVFAISRTSCFSKIIPKISLWCFLNLSAFAKILGTARWFFCKTFKAGLDDLKNFNLESYLH